MRTRSGHKYEEEKAKAAQIKSPPKEDKHPKAKAKSEVKEKTIEENVSQTETKRTRNKANTEVKAKKAVISPKKVPQKPVISPVKRSLRKPVESIKTPEKQVIGSKKSPEKESKTESNEKKVEPIDTKETEPVVDPTANPEVRGKRTARMTAANKKAVPQIKSPPKEAQHLKAKDKKEVEEKTESIDTKEAEKVDTTANTERSVRMSARAVAKSLDKKAKPVPPKEVKEKTIESIDAKETEVVDTTANNEIQPEVKERRTARMTTRKVAVIEDKKATAPPKQTKQPKAKAKNEMKEKIVEENVGKTETKRTRNYQKKESSSKKSEEEETKSQVNKKTIESIDAKEMKLTDGKETKPLDTNDSESVQTKESEMMDTKEMESVEIKEIESVEAKKSGSVDTKESELMETKESEPVNPKETESVDTSNSELTDIKESELMDTKETEPTPEPTVATVKRKSSETEVLPPKVEAVKRLRVSRFTVPSIPQICGQLYSFGEEIAGELGPRLKRVDDIKLKSNEPSIVTDEDGLTLDNIVSVVCGAMHSSCLSSEGEVITFGCNDDSALGRDTQTGSDETDDSIDVDESEEREAKTPKLVSGLPPAVKLTAGDMHTCALCKDGSVYVWGNLKDESKKFGLFADSPKSDNSDDFNATPLPKRIPLETKIVDIASGCHHILLLTEDGDLLSYGEGSKGQLGRIKDSELHSIASDRILFLNPQKVEFGVGIVIEKVWANHWSSYAKTTSGDIYVWGLNNYHQLGFKSSGSVRVTNPDPNESQTSLNLIIELKPTKVEKMPTNVLMIANGQHHMLALDSDGQVFSCGSNTYGKLGYKTENADQTAESPQMISKDAFNGQKVKHIACGEFCSLAVTESGQLMAWGQGSAHIGSEDFTDIEVPTRVKGSLADSTRFVSVSSGSQHSLLIGNKNTINGN